AVFLMVEARKSSQPYAHAQQLPCFSDDHPKAKGTYLQIDPSELDSEKPQLFYSHPNGEIYVGDAASWLRSLTSGSKSYVCFRISPPIVRNYTLYIMPLCLQFLCKRCSNGYIGKKSAKLHF